MKFLYCYSFCKSCYFITTYHENFQWDHFGIVSYGERQAGGDQEDDGHQDVGGTLADLEAVGLHDEPVPVHGDCHVSHGRHIYGDAGKSLHKSNKKKGNLL